MLERELGIVVGEHGEIRRGGRHVLRRLIRRLLRLLRLCGAKAVLLAGADGYKPGTPAYADSLLHAHTGRGAAFNTAMAGAIKACGLDVTFITPSEYAK